VFEISRRIASHVKIATRDAVSADALTIAKRSLLDAVGVTLAASTLGEGGTMFADIARQAANPDGATVIGFGFKAAPAMAAFANGAMAHALDYEDTFDLALVHPNAAVVPAALAIAESDSDITGAELAVAIALGADLTCRLGLSIEGHERRGLGARFLCGAFGATAASGKLLGLSEEQLLHAFALVMFQAGFAGEAMTYAPSHMRAVREAFAAKAGVIAAQLAKRGLRAFDRPFDGKQGFFSLYTDGYEPAAFDGLGQEFLGAQVSFKPWPSCRGTHAYVEAALALASEHRIAAEMIERAETVVSPFFRALSEPPERKRRPETAIDAKFSIPYTLAVALHDGDVGLSAYRAERIEDQALHAMADRIEHRIEESWTTQKATRGILSLHLRDGRSYTKSVTTPLGHPANPMSDEALRRKFMTNAGYARVPLAPGQAERIVQTIETLETIPNIGVLFAQQVVDK
jgi:2-methylcitrate dehydratase PrpD